MGFAIRNFLLDHNDGLYRVPNRTPERMLRVPGSRCVPRFTNARVRMAEIIVELLDRHPIRIAWRTFTVTNFDETGSLDSAAFCEHQRAIVEMVLAPVLGPKRAPCDAPATVVDATNRFIVQGGRWVPSRKLMRLIDNAALGHVTCARL